jgi:RNA 3'-terminal phosphate cyclase (ATP)
MSMIEVNGRFREGGGQILRTALGLSCLLQKPFRIYDIRKGRRKPGLMPQHLTCIRAARLLSNAQVTGDTAGSAELSFSPGEVKSGDYLFDIGTAGSTSLVFQTIIPAVIFSKIEKTTITLKGGTHVPFSPCYHYLDRVLGAFLRSIGITVKFSIASYGFYPKGGGKVSAEIYATERIKPLSIIERGNLSRLKGLSGVGNLPLSIAERQKEAFVRKLHPIMQDRICPVDVELLNVSTPGQGTFFFLHAESDQAFAGFTSLGERGKKAEVIGQEVAEEFLKYYVTGAAFDPHLSDQVVLYLAMCRKESIFSTSCITEHLMTNLWVIGLFHEYSYAVEGEPGKPGIVRINPLNNNL